MILADSHLHLADLVKFQKNPYSSLFSDFMGLEFELSSCAHNLEEYEIQKKVKSELEEKYKNIKILLSFGLHPQKKEKSLCVQNAVFLENLLQKKEICAIGECGFDLYTLDDKMNITEQEKFFLISLALAQKYCVPIVIHNRRGIEYIFKHIKELAKIQSVIFHGFSYGKNEADFILKNNVNAYFSFGKNLLRSSQKYEINFISLPQKTLLLETDSPFMHLQGESYGSEKSILEIYKKAAALQKKNFDEFSKIIAENFKKAFLLEK